MPGEAFAADAAAAGEVEAVTPELSGFAIGGDAEAISGRSGRTGLLVRDIASFRRLGSAAPAVRASKKAELAPELAFSRRPA